VHGQTLAIIGGKHDAAKTDPVVIPASCVPCDMAIRLHINTGRLAMVVEVEDQPLPRSAVTRQHSHCVTPVA
jgi:hypothetical protein